MHNRIIREEDITAILDDAQLQVNGSYVGVIYGDTRERWPDGTPIITSTVQEIVDSLGKRFALTLNSVYEIRNEQKPATSAKISKSSLARIRNIEAVNGVNILSNNNNPD